MVLKVIFGEFNKKEPIIVPLYLSALPPVDQIALWTCYSPLLGKGYAGEFEIKNYQLPSCGNADWVACDHLIRNPIAIFRDFGRESPFLALYGFEPQTVYRYSTHGVKFHPDYRKEYLSWIAAKKY